MYYGLINSMNRAVVNAFNPTSLSGLKLWLDASDFNTAGAISQWNDKSGLNNHLLQPTGVNQPSVVLNQKNGKPIVRFNTLSYMSLTSAISSSTDRTDFFIVKKVDADKAIGLSDDTLAYSNLFNSTNFITCTANSYQTFSPASANYDVFANTRSGETMVLYKNGAVLGSINLPYIRTVANYSIFGRLNAGFTSIFDCAEEIYYNRVLTTQEITDIQTYLATKWAI